MKFDVRGALIYIAFMLTPTSSQPPSWGRRDGGMSCSFRIIAGIHRREGGWIGSIRVFRVHRRRYDGLWRLASFRVESGGLRRYGGVVCIIRVASGSHHHDGGSGATVASGRLLRP
jgi:hypothetical protein